MTQKNEYLSGFNDGYAKGYADGAQMACVYHRQRENHRHYMRGLREGRENIRKHYKKKHND